MILQGARFMENEAGQTDPHRALVPLLMRHERQVFACIYTLLPNRHDAEDILQEDMYVGALEPVEIARIY